MALLATIGAMRGDLEGPENLAAFTKRNITFRDGKIIKAIEIDKPRNAREELSNMPVIVEEDEG